MFDLDKPFQHCLIIEDRSGAYPRRDKRAFERCATRVGYGLTYKHHVTLERFASDKHSSLFGPFVRSEGKIFLVNMATDLECNELHFRVYTYILTFTAIKIVFLWL